MAPKRQETCRVCGQPRAAGSEMVLCPDHLREYNRAANKRGINAQSGMRHPDAHRLYEYQREAQRQGANEDEGWWIALACEIEHQAGRTRPRWLVPFVAAELAWLRANRKTLARLDGLAKGAA